MPMGALRQIAPMCCGAYPVLRTPGDTHRHLHHARSYIMLGIADLLQLATCPVGGRALQGASSLHQPAN